MKVHIPVELPNKIHSDGECDFEWSNSVGGRVRVGMTDSARSMGILDATNSWLISINGKVVGHIDDKGLHMPVVVGGDPSQPPSVVRRSVIDIRDAGAVGDGVTDNTEVLNRLFHDSPNGSVFYIPNETFAFSGTLELRRHGCTIYGHGQDARLVKTGNYGQVGLYYEGNGIASHGFELSSDADHRAGGHLMVANGIGLRFSDLVLEYSPEFALFIGSPHIGARDVLVRNVTVRHSHADGIHFGQVTDGAILDCDVSDCADDAIAVGADAESDANYIARGILVSRNRINRCKRRGILLEDCEDVTVADNVGDTVGSAAIWASVYRSHSFRNKNVRLLRNTFTNTNSNPGEGRASIIAAYTDGLSLHGNRMTQAKTGGVNGALICDVNDLDADGNTFKGAGQHGICAYGDTTEGPDDIGAAGRKFSPAWKNWRIRRNSIDDMPNGFGFPVYLIPPANVRLPHARIIANDGANNANPNGIAAARTDYLKLDSNTIGSFIDGGDNQPQQHAH